MYPYRGVNFMNLFIWNVHLDGLVGRGFDDLSNNLNSFSKLKLLKLLGKTTIQYALPFLHRFIPLAETGI